MENNSKKKRRKNEDIGLPGGKRLREFYALICKEKQYFGKLDTRIHTDLLHVVHGYSRKRPRIKISSERIKSIDEALRAGTDCPFNDVEEIRRFIFKRKEEKLRNFDAEQYYDKNKTVAYTANNQVAQQRLTSRCVDLIHTGRDKSEIDDPNKNNTKSGLLLDIGCGSGLSSQYALGNAASRAGFAIGIDRSPDMLLQCDRNILDVILMDMGQKLPFRSSVFDTCISVSAIHFLFGPKDEKERGQRFMSSLSRCLIPVDDHHNYRFSAQFFPETSSVPELLLESAQNNGFKDARLLLDYTHHTTAFRWYLHCWPEKAQGCSQCILAENEVSNRINAQCCLCLADYDSSFSNKKHIIWVKNDHARRARQLIRKYNHDPNIIDNEVLRNLAVKLREAFGAKVTQEDLVTIHYKRLENMLHPSIIE